MIGELTNHLWQSTLFAIVAGLLTVAFRKNRAEVRYWLWFSASFKFLVPFSLLIGLGSHLGWAPTAKRIAAPAVSFTMVQITQPFPDASPSAPFRTGAIVDWVPLVILGVWLCGFAVIALMRSRSWRQIRAAVRSSTPIDVLETMQVRSSPGLLEPGVVGLFRPMLLLPAGIAERLTPRQLEAVLAHELCHVRRRDNLTSAIHMIVEAVFWFHPLVWWIGARLLEERERACDEAVLSLGNEPHDYAEAILNVCKSYVESPLSFVSGVTGSNLKKRIHAILTGRVARGLTFAKKLTLAAAGIAAVGVPILVGILSAPSIRAQSPDSSDMPDWQKAAGGKMAFEVASVKPWMPGMRPTPPNFPLDSGNAKPPGGRFSAGLSLPNYISFAYKLGSNPQQDRVLTHLPESLSNGVYEIEARAEGNPTKDQMRLMMQSLLADRFKLKVHFETQEVPVFALTLVKPGKTGPKLRPHDEGPPCPDSFTMPAPFAPPKAGDVFPTNCEDVQGRRNPNGMRLVGARNTTMPMLGRIIYVYGSFSSGDDEVDRSIMDQTGLNGRFDFTLEYMPGANDRLTRSLSSLPGAPHPNAPPPDSQGPTLLGAVRKQLGLKLMPSKGPIRILIVDHVERPSKN